MLSSYFPALDSKPAPIEMEESGTRRRKKFKKPAQKHQKMQFGMQNSHPALQCKDNSIDLLDLGRDVLNDVAQRVGESSQARMLQLALSSCDLHDIIKNNSRYWRDAAVTDFNSMASLPGIGSFKLYHFFCNFKWLEGMFFIHRQKAFQYSRLPCRPRPMEMLEVEFTDTGLLMSIWRSPGLASDVLPPQKKGHFLEVKFDNFNDSEPLDLVYEKIVTKLPGTGELSHDMSDSKEFTVEGFLSRRGSLADKLVRLWEDGYLIPLHIVAANGLDSKFLNSDGSWPQALPKPGVYVTDLGHNGFVGYTSEVFRLTLPANVVSEEYRFIDVKVASAFVMPLEEQVHLCYNDYMAYEEGLQGNPSQLNDLHVLHLPSQIGAVDDLRARAWYSPCPPTDWMEGRWKLAVVNENELLIMLDGATMNLWRLRRRRDIAGLQP